LFIVIPITWYVFYITPFSGQGNNTRLLVTLIFKSPSCQTFKLESEFGRAKKIGYQHIVNGNLESKKQKLNYNSEGQIAFGDVLKSLAIMRNHSHNFLCN